MKDVNTSDLNGLLDNVSTRIELAVAEAERYAVGPSLVALVQAVRDQQLVITTLRELMSRLEAPAAKPEREVLHVDIKDVSSADAKAALEVIKEEMVVEVINAVTPAVAATKAEEVKPAEVKADVKVEDKKPATKTTKSAK